MASAYSDEYLIYGYLKYNEQYFGRNNWQFISKNTDMVRCCQEAQKLYSSDNFDRIEIKKKYFDEALGRFCLKTFKVIGARKKINIYRWLIGFFIAFIILSQFNLSNFFNF